MNEHEEDEEVVIKDKRKFNVDGSLREGVVIEPVAPKVPETNIETPKAENVPTFELDETETLEDFAKEEGLEDAFDEAQIPGADDPASFANFLLSLASQAASALGLSENPMTGKRQANMELSKYWLDVLGMLRAKTDGNLHQQEKNLFDGLLSDLRMQFVQLTRVAEEQLKHQAAKKFSANDILGRK